MSFKKYISPKRSLQSTNSEHHKLEKSQRSELRMISTAAFKFRSKFMKAADSRGWPGENEASPLRMYETHFPGFCYLRDGKYRKKVMHANKGTTVPVESSEEIKALLFTENELDIHKVLCLHLLGTHIQNRRHMQSKPLGVTSVQVIYSRINTVGRLRIKKVQEFAEFNDNGDYVLSRDTAPKMGNNQSERVFIRIRQRDGLIRVGDEGFLKSRRRHGRFCIFVRSVNHGHKRFAVQRVPRGNTDDKKVLPEVNNEVLPRYILEVLLPDCNLLSAEMNSHIDDNDNRKKSPQVPIYVNNDIKAIVSSVLEALKAVNSSKLEQLISLARNPEKIRGMLSREDIQQYITELGGSYLISNPNSYSVIMTHPKFEKVSDLSSAEIVSQVLDIAPNSHMRNMLNIVRKTVGRRYEELVPCYVMPGKKNRTQGGKGSIFRSTPKTSFMSCGTSTKTIYSENDDFYKMTVSNEVKMEKNTSLTLGKAIKRQKKVESHSFGSVCQRSSTQNLGKSFPKLEDCQGEEKATLSDGPVNKIDGGIQQFTRLYDAEINKYDLKNLNNSQRILLGLKIASLKNRPVNMHQFENKKQVDVTSLITSIVRPNNPNQRTNFLSRDDPYGRKTKKTFGKFERYQVQRLENLTRAVLSNLRHDIAMAENKKRVKKFIDTPL